MATAIDLSNRADTDASALYRLMSWLSPSYPVSAYSFSHGLEYAIADEPITRADQLLAWIDAIMGFGSGRNDAILLCAAWRACGDGNLGQLVASGELALALSGSAERLEETRTQGRAFLATTLAAWPQADLARYAEAVGQTPAYPIAVAITAAAHHVPLAGATGAYLHAFAANLVSAGVRLIPLGQTDGQRMIAALMSTIARLTEEATTSSLDDIGGCTFLADIAAMAHETQRVRLFRS